MHHPDTDRLAEAIADKLLSEFHEIKVELKKDLDELKALFQYK
jgi:hypothetical protein